MICDILFDFRSELSGALVSKKGNLMKEILSCGLGYHHIKKVNMASYCKRTVGEFLDGASPLPDFEVFRIFRGLNRCAFICYEDI
jgi:hypothetical protein